MAETNTEFVKSRRPVYELILRESKDTSAKDFIDACDRIEQADKKLMYCGECGSDEVETIIDKVTFDNDIYIYVPVRKCKKCSFQWTDEIGGIVWDKNATLFEQQQKINIELTEELKGKVEALTRFHNKKFGFQEKIEQQQEMIRELAKECKGINQCFECRYGYRSKLDPLGCPDEADAELPCAAFVKEFGEFVGLSDLIARAGEFLK